MPLSGNICSSTRTSSSPGSNLPNKHHLRSRGTAPATALPQEVAPATEHVGETFNGSISVDGNRYRNCIFERCIIAYGGGVPPSFSDCHFRNSTLSFVGAAASTLTFLKAMDSPSSGLQQVVRETFRG